MNKPKVYVKCNAVVSHVVRVPSIDFDPAIASTLLTSLWIVAV